jgi:hypothetical protein
MTKRKIKIVDAAESYDDLKLQIQDDAVETKPEVEQPVISRSEKRTVTIQRGKKIKPVEEVTLAVADLSIEPVKLVEEPEVLKPDKKVRVQEFAECPDCNKMITPKSLKYSHKNKTCSAITRDDPKPLPQTKPGVKAAKTTKAKATQEIPQAPTLQSTPPPAIIPLTAEECAVRATKVFPQWGRVFHADMSAHECPSIMEVLFGSRQLEVIDIHHQKQVFRWMEKT